MGTTEGITWATFHCDRCGGFAHPETTTECPFCQGPVHEIGSRKVRKAEKARKMEKAA